MAVTYLLMGNESVLLLLLAGYILMIGASLVFTQRLARRFKPPILAASLATVLMGIATVLSAYLIEAVPMIFGGQGYQSLMFGGILFTAAFPIALVLALISGITVFLRARRAS